jgi:hypothetical protein
MCSLNQGRTNTETTSETTKEATMNQFTAFAAVIALATTLSSVAAKAEFHYGPVQQGNQCWNKHMSNGLANTGWGYWTECPKPASAPVVRKPRQSRQ